MSVLTRLVLTDYRTEVDCAASAAFKFFKDFQRWSEWSSVIVGAEAKGDPWAVGRSLRFRPVILGRPFVWLPVRIFEVSEGRRIRWGVKTRLGSQFHQFTFIRLDADRCEIHHEEWASGLMALINAPIKGVVAHFNKSWADDLAAALKSLPTTKKPPLKKSRVR